jgi:hypothetical protein
MIRTGPSQWLPGAYSAPPWALHELLSVPSETSFHTAVSAVMALMERVTGNRVGTMGADGETRAGEQWIIALQHSEYRALLGRVAKRTGHHMRRSLHCQMMVRHWLCEHNDHFSLAGTPPGTHQLLDPGFYAERVDGSLGNYRDVHTGRRLISMLPSAIGAST